PSMTRLFARPFADRNFRKVMLFLGGWSFAVNLAMPFFTVFLVEDLALPITVPIAMGMVAQVANIVSLPFWGRLSDRRSNKTVIALAGPLLLAASGCWVLAATLLPHALILPLLAAAQVVAGAAGAGLDLACGNLAFKTAPKGEPTVYLGVNGLVKSLAGGLAPLAGGALAEHLGGTSLSFAIGSLSIIHVRPLAFVFMASIAAGVGALLLLLPVAEDGHRVLRRPLFRYMNRGFKKASRKRRASHGPVRNRPAGAA
ncbi:MAG: MFS transporter, partial [Stellaceae bacterium]